MAEPAAILEPMTFEDAARLDPDLYPGEIVEGVWTPMTRSTWRHGEVARNATFLLTLYMREHPEWTAATCDPGAMLKGSKDTLRGPDVAMIRCERRPTGTGVEGWLVGAPELAVEVAGDSQSSSLLARKALEYLSAGSQMVWVIDGQAELVMVFTPPNQLRILGAEDVLDGGELLPGFTCAVSEFFR
jgi:Uma2 family endonuclease